MKTTKAASLSWDDLAHAVPHANPEKRVLQDINFRELVEQCADWPALQRMEADVRERYGRTPGLAVGVLVRASELVDMEVADEETRRGVTRMLASSVAPFLVKEGAYSLRPTVLPTLLAALAALQYSNPSLNNILAKMFYTGVGTLKVGPLASCLASFAQLGARLPDDALTAAAERCESSMRHASAEDVGNLAAGLAACKKLPERFNGNWLVKLSSRSLPLLGEVPAEQLVDLLALFVKQDFPLTPTWLAAFQKALIAALPGLERPASYASLLFSLAKGSLSIEEHFLAALLARLAAPGPRPPGRPAGRSAAAPPSPSLLARMRPTQLAVVAAVLSIYGYAPEPAWAEQYVAALESRAADFEAKQVVTVIDTCVELGIPLGADLLDELLAVSEAGLAGLAPARLLALAGALAAAEHAPDGPWLRQLQAALLAVAGSCSGAELAEVVAVLMQLPDAYPHDGANTAAVLAAVKARAAALGGLEAQTRGSIQAALQQMGHPGAVAFASSLQAPPPPPPPKAPAAVPTAVAAAAAAPPTAAAGATSRRAASSASAGTSGRSAAAPAPAAAVAAPAPATASAATSAAPAASARSRSSAAAAPRPPPPPPPPPQPATARGRGRTAAYEDDYEEDEVDEFEEDEDYAAPPPATAKKAAAAQSPVPSRATMPSPAPAQQSAPPPPPPPLPVSSSDEDFVASTRTSRRRR